MKVQWDAKYKTISVYVVITATVIIIIGLFFLNLHIVGDALSAFFSTLVPFIVGLAAAYLLSRPALFIEKHWFGFVEHRKPHPGVRRGLSIFTLFVIVFGIFVLLIYFVIPQLLESAGTLIINIPGYLDTLEKTISSWLDSIHLLTPEIQAQLQDFENTFLNFTSLMNQLVEKLPSFITSIGTGVFNFFVGMIVCVYFLFSREKFIRQAKKVLFAVFKLDFATKFMDMMKYSNNVFLGYIMGTLMSTAFIGVATLVFMTILRMPYAILITVIIAATNIIPFFGPFLGAIPSAVILFIVDPVYALVFVIFIVVLQQVDGNIVLPKLVGMNVGLSAFWVLFALLVGGGLFGFWGLILGVPVFAVIYALIRTLVYSLLEKKGVPPEKFSTPRDFASQEPRKKMAFGKKK